MGVAFAWVTCFARSESLIVGNFQTSLEVDREKVRERKFSCIFLLQDSSSNHKVEETKMNQNEMKLSNRESFVKREIHL